MDILDEDIVEAFFYPGGLPRELRHLHSRQDVVVVENENLDIAVEEGFYHLNRTATHSNPLDGAGDGEALTPAQIVSNAQNAPAMIIIHGKKVSSFPWSHLENVTSMLIVLSGVLFRKMFDAFGIDMRSLFLLGLSYNAYVTLFQCLLAFGSFWFRGCFGAYHFPF